LGRCQKLGFISVRMIPDIHNLLTFVVSMANALNNSLNVTLKEQLDRRLPSAFIDDILVH
jgi:hypothetical protein